jgi:hypothetical protein
MFPAIWVIPTFGTCCGCSHAVRGYKPADTKYSGQLGDMDDPGQRDYPDRWVLGY